jgi:hypothetical protein
MNSTRLAALMMAFVMTVSCIPPVWAEEAKPEQSGPDGGAVAAAVVSNFFFVPGKTIACATSGALWTVVMAITAGTYYKQAGHFVHDACTGKWVLTGQDFMDDGE